MDDIEVTSCLDKRDRKHIRFGEDIGFIDLSSVRVSSNRVATYRDLQKIEDKLYMAALASYEH